MSTKNFVHCFVWNINILRNLWKTIIIINFFFLGGWFRDFAIGLRAKLPLVIIHCSPSIYLFKWFYRGLKLFSDVWNENAALFKGLMKINLNPPILYYGFMQLGNKIVLKLGETISIQHGTFGSSVPDMEIQGLLSSVHCCLNLSQYQATSWSGAS